MLAFVLSASEAPSLGTFLGRAGDPDSPATEPRAGAATRATLVPERGWSHRRARDQTGSRKLSPTKHQKVVPSADKRMEHGGHAALREGSSLRLLLDDICARWDSSLGQEAGHPLPGPMGTNGRLPGPERPVGIRYTVYLNTSSSREGKDPVQGNHQLQTAFRLQNTQVKHVPWDQERRRSNSKVLVNEPFERTYAGRAGRSRGPREQWQGHAGKACTPVR